MITKDDVEKASAEIEIAVSVGISSLLINGGERILKLLRKKGVSEETIKRIDQQANEVIKQVFEDIDDDG